jgi:pyruvate carboxylase subunit B
MKLVVVRDGTPVEVEVERGDGGAYLVTVGDRAYTVDAAPVGAGAASLRIDGAQREIAVHPLPGGGAAGAGRYRLAAGGHAVPAEVEVLDPLTHLAHQASAKAGGPTRREVTAYMPGRVVAILAPEGTEVTPGQGVVVLEAMKMENEIQAESAGTVRKLFVEVGQAVEGGDPLFELGPNRRQDADGGVAADLK